MTYTVSTWIIAALMSVSGQSGPNQMLPGRPADKRDRTFEFLFNMSPTQRAHSKMHGFLYAFERPLETLTSLEVESSVINSMTAPVIPTATALLSDMACRADGVFIGQVLNAETFPIIDGTFLFTDYKVRITEVLKVPEGAPISSGRETVVSRLGGSLTIDNTVVKTEARWLPPLQVSSTYLFFVKFSSETSDFVSGPTSDTGHVARLQENKWMFLSDAVSSNGNLATVGIDRSLVTRALIQNCKSMSSQR
jgi:hypothetical protein